MNRTFSFLLPLALSPIALAPLVLAPLASRAQGVGAPALTILEATPQVLGGRGARPITLRLPPGVTPPQNARIGIFLAGSQSRLAEISRAFSASPNGLQATITLDAEPGRYDIRLLRGDKTRAPLTQSATVSVAGIDREPGWWLFNGSPVAARADDQVDGQASGQVPNAPLFWPGLKRTLSKSDKSRFSNARTDLPVAWRTQSFPPLTAWLRDAGAARDLALRLGRAGRGFVGCALFAARDPESAQAAGAALSESDARALSAASPEAIARAAQAARAACQSISPDAALILSIESMPPALAARLIDLAAPECDAVHLADLDTADAAGLWPLKAARRVAEEQPQFDLPLFVTPRDGAAAAEAWMSGATGIVPAAPDSPGSPDSGAQVLEGGFSRVLEANLSLFVGSVTLEDTGLLRAGDALSLFRRMRDIGRVPLLARTYEVAGRRDRSGREGRRTAEPFAIRWTRGTPPPDLLAALRDAAKDGSRAYFEGDPFPPSASTSASSSQPNAPAFDAQGWRDLLQASVKNFGAASVAAASTSSDYAAEDTAEDTGAAPAIGGAAAELKMSDLWTFGLARGESVPVEQSVVATPSRTPSAVELGDVAPPRGQSERERERVRPAPRVLATLGDGSVGTLASPSSASVRRDEAGAALPRGEVVWTPSLLLSPAAASPSEAARIATYDASISTLLQPALVRLFERANGPAPRAGATSDDATALPSLPMARGVRVCVRSSSRGTLLLGLVNPLDRTRAVSLQTQAAGGYAVDLATNRVLPTRTRALRVEMDIEIPAHGFRLIALAKDAATFATDRDARRLKVRAR